MEYKVKTCVTRDTFTEDEVRVFYSFNKAHWERMSAQDKHNLVKSYAKKLVKVLVESADD